MGGLPGGREAALLSSDRCPVTLHVIGSTLLETCPAFKGKQGQDVSEWLAKFLRLTSAHEIPPAFLPNELIIKFQGKSSQVVPDGFPWSG